MKLKKTPILDTSRRKRIKNSAVYNKVPHALSKGLILWGEKIYMYNSDNTMQASSANCIHK